jgi:hypothetical protein
MKLEKKTKETIKRKKKNSPYQLKTCKREAVNNNFA